MPEQRDERFVAWAELALRLERGHPVSRRDVEQAMGVTYKTATEWWSRLAQVVPEAVERKRGRTLILVKPAKVEDEALVRRAVALDFAVDALRTLAGTPWHDELCGLRDAARLNLNARAHVPGELATGFAVVPGGEPVRDQREVLRAFTDAWSARRRCRIAYAKASGEERPIECDPLGLLLRGDHVVAVVRERGGRRPQLRRLRVDRMLRVTVLTERFQRPTARTFDAATHLRHAWGVTVMDGVAPQRVVVEVRGPWAVLLEHFKMHPSQTLEPAERDGWATVTWTLAPCFELQAFLRGLGDHVELIQPPGGLEALVPTSSGG